MKDEAAQSLARKRWEKMTPEERKTVAAKLNRAKNKKYTKEERSELGRAAAQARWSKKSGSS